MKRIAVITITLALVAAACGSATDATADTVADVPRDTTTLATTSTTHPPTTTTSSPATTTTTTTTDTTTEADREAISNTYDIVFSSETSYEDKLPYLQDPDGLEETVLGYQETGKSMGGVSLAATKITVNDDVAEVIYDFLFAGTPTYPDLTGDAVLVDGTWMITREMFCSIMTSARVGCPAP